MGMHMKLIKTSFKNTNKQTNKGKKTPPISPNKQTKQNTLKETLLHFIKI